MYGESLSTQRPSGTCSNTEGGYECDCLEGTYYDTVSKTCIETNECAEDPDVCGEGVCKNIRSSVPTLLDVDWNSCCPYDYELTGNTCGGEGIGASEAHTVDYSADFDGVEAHCSCEQGYKKVNFYDPINPQYGRNTFPTCIDDSECIGQEKFCTCQDGFQLDYTTHKCVQIVCEDIDTFKFPIMLNPDNYEDCDWISKNSKRASARRERYCNDTHIAAACPNACTKCLYQMRCIQR